MKLGILVGAAPLFAERAKLIELCQRDDVYKLAVDGGMDFFCDENICPDGWVGDLDSTRQQANPFFIEGLSEAAMHTQEEISLTDSPIQTLAKTDAFPEVIETLLLPVQKDETDMATACQWAFEKGCQELVLFGGAGGKRMEHMLANFQLMHRYAKEGKKVTMVSDGYENQVLVNETLSFSEDKKGFLSIFAVSASASVKIQGLLYEFDGVFHNDNPLGVSNQFCGKEASISVSEGAILVMYEA